MTGIVSSGSCATDTKVKPCTLWRIGTATERKTVTGCGNAKRLSQEQCPVATGLVTRPTMMNLPFSTVLRIVSGAMSSCYWTGYQTNYDEPFLSHCHANYVLSGVNNVHSNKREDRRWNFYCCRAIGYCTKQCYWIN